MFRLLERYRTIVVFVAVIVLPLLIYRANAVEPANANVLDRLVLAATTPIHRAMSWAVGRVSDVWSHYVDLRHAREENAQLAQRLRRVELERDELSALGVENEQLRGLLLIKERNSELESIQANVIAAGTSPLARTMEIDRGAVDKVARGMVVISDAGLVGLVMRVAWTSAEVLMIADEKVSLSAIVTRSRARGRLTGSGLAPGYGLELTEVLRSDDVRPGDRVTTSGLGGVFPKGIPIGEIVEVRTSTGAQHRTARVAPYVDFARLEHVMVLIEAPLEDPLITPEPLRPPALRGLPPPELTEPPDAGIAADAGPPPRVRATPDAGPRVRVVREVDAGVSVDAAPVREADGRDDAGIAEPRETRLDAGARDADTQRPHDAEPPRDAAPRIRDAEPAPRDASPRIRDAEPAPPRDAGAARDGGRTRDAAGGLPDASASRASRPLTIAAWVRAARSGGA